MLLLNQLPIKVQSEKVSFSVARQLFKQLWLLTPGNARPFVPTETQSWLLPKRRGKEWPWDMVQSKKRHSHHSSAGALACFFSLFLPFPERKSSAIWERELGKRKMCIPDCLQRMGSARGKNGVCSYGLCSCGKTAKWTSGTTVHLMPFTTLLQNNPCICEINLPKIKWKSIVLLDLIYYYFFKTEVG